MKLTDNGEEDDTLISTALTEHTHLNMTFFFFFIINATYRPFVVVGIHGQIIPKKKKY